MTQLAFLPGFIQPFLQPRILHGLIFAICSGLLGFGYYLEFVEGLAPCPLCMSQRLMFYVTGLTAILALLHNPGLLGHRIYSGLASVFCLLGGALAGRQLWLQSLPPDKVPPCGPDLDYMLEAFPLMEVISVMIRGSGNCAEVSWTFLGISIPGWALAAFIFLFIITLINMLTRPIPATSADN